MAGPWLDALLGGIYSAGVKLAYNAGLNFKDGVAASFNTTTKLIDIVASANDTQATQLAAYLHGLGLGVDSDGNLYPQDRPRLYRLEERFPGSIVSPNIGTHQWTQSGSNTPTRSKQISGLGNLTALRITTDTTVSDWTACHLGATATSHVLSPAHGVLKRAQFVASTGLSNRRVFYGFSSDFSSDTPTHALGILYDTALSPFFQVLARTASAGSPVPSSIGLITSTIIFSIVESESGFKMYANDSLLGEVTTNLPAVAANPVNFGFSVRALTGVATNLTAAYAGVRAEIDGWDSDLSLEG